MVISLSCKIQIRTAHTNVFRDLKKMMRSLQRRQQLQQFRERIDHCIRPRLLRELHRMLLLRRPEDDVAADSRSLGPWNISLDVVRHGDAVCQIHPQFPGCNVVNLRARLAQMAHGGLLALKCSVRSLILLVRIAICTSAEPVSVSCSLFCSITCVFSSFLIMVTFTSSSYFTCDWV